jgi:putative ABC transport system ATP-binding protein
MSDIIKIEEAVKKYRRGVEEVRAIDGVNLNISRGDYLAIVGRSGSGKTTLLNLIGCIDRPTSGRVSVHGMETGDLSERALATIRSTTVGFVFQQFFLIPTLTAIENVMVPGRFCAKRKGNLEARARKLLDQVGLGHRANHLPNELSGGEMQRVALARALINRPAILLADEPTGNLDTKSAAEIALLFKELNASGLTLVVVTHGNELTDNATRIVQLLDGKVVEEQELRPVPFLEWEQESRPEPVSVPEYMPSSLKKRRWGSPAVVASMILLGAAMAAAAFMPFTGNISGYKLLNQGLFTTQFYSENSTRLWTGKSTILFTGIWPIALGLLLMTAGILFLFNMERIGRWSALVIGLLCSVIAAIDIILIASRLGPDSSVGYGLWVLLGAGVVSLALAVLLFFVKRRRPSGQDM